jgi:hypothetical protein
MPTLTQTLYFGCHKGKPLPQVPSDYLRWTLATVNLSSGVRAAVTDELMRRGETPPPAGKPEPGCHRCGWMALTYNWATMSDGRRFIRRRCQRCGSHAGQAPLIEPFVSRADAAEGESPQTTTPEQQAPATPSPPPPEWVGWWRPGSRQNWHPLTRAATETEAFNRLMTLRDRGDLCCLPVGKSPNRDRPTR